MGGKRHPSAGALGASRRPGSGKASSPRRAPLLKALAEKPLSSQERKGKPSGHASLPPALPLKSRQGPTLKSRVRKG